MRPEDIVKLTIPSEPRITSDGTRVFFAVSKANLDEDRYDRAIWVHEGQGARQFTAGPSDFLPATNHPPGRNRVRPI